MQRLPRVKNDENHSRFTRPPPVNGAVPWVFLEVSFGS
jgi:hypothetical protein